MAFATRMLPPARKARELVEAGFLGKVYAADLYTIADQLGSRARSISGPGMPSAARKGADI